MKITAHCLIKNEGRFVWYSVMSIINYVDKVLLWDTGSTDGTQDVVGEILKAGKDKVDFREYGPIDIDGFTKARQAMLDVTKTDWIVMVDGDEIWWEDSIVKLVEAINSFKGKTIQSVVVPTINLIGDFYHYQEAAAGQYSFGKWRGHYNLRAVNRNIPGLHSYGPHGTWGWVDEENKMIQNREPKEITLVEAPYLHATFLQRSLELEREKDVPKRTRKLKYEFGIPFPGDFYYPEVLFKKRPSIVPSVWEKRGFNYLFRATSETLPKMLRRRLFLGRKVGY